MEFCCKLLTISFLFVQFDPLLCASHEVFFDIMDGRNNEVIFIGEENITLLCHVTNTSNANVTITVIGSETVATNNGVGSCIEYNIVNATQQTDGDYSCTAEYEDNDTGTTVEVFRMLSVNVKNSSEPACLRNGSGVYGEGDSLQLSCYCESSLKCVWIKTVVGSQNGEIIATNEETTARGKIIRRITVGPLSPEETEIRYDCSYGSKSGERCSIGPADVSINDDISSFHPQSDQLEEGCPMSSVPIFQPVTVSVTSDMTSTVSTTTVHMATVSMSTDSLSSTDAMLTGMTNVNLKTTENTEENIAVEEKQDHLFLYVIIGVSGLLVLSLVLFLLIVVLVGKSNERKSPQQQQELEDEEETKLGSFEENLDNSRTNENPSITVDHDHGKTNDVTLNDEDEEEFCTGDVTEYNVPVAFRVDDIETFRNGDVDSPAIDVIIAD